jgi:D-alanyl-D-alanine carboxypeptidase (penicillin-binding protein 5/6)
MKLLFALLLGVLTCVPSLAEDIPVGSPQTVAPIPLPPPAPIVPAPPALNARAWVLIDFDSGAVLAENNADMRVEPASITKVMTIYSLGQLLKSGRVKLTDNVPISARARSMTGSRMFVEAGANITLEELMKGDIIQSGNDASVALAEYVAGSEDSFASLMNQNAATLGMTGTHFVNSTGLPDPNHYTTARDLARLSIALIRDHPDIYRWFSVREFTHGGITQPNRNKLLWRDSSVDGIKTGFHEAAGYCLAASAKRGDMRLVAIVLGTDSETARADAAQSLLNYGFQFYETHKIFTGGKVIKSSRVWKGDVDEAQIGLAEDLVVTVPRGDLQRLQSAITFDGRLVAPLVDRQPVGKLQVTLDQKVIAERPAIVLQPINPGGMIHRTVDSLKLWWQQ